MKIVCRCREFSDRIENNSKDIVNMIAVYTFQTFVLSLLFLMFATSLGRAIIATECWIKPVLSDSIKKSMKMNL